VPGREQAAIVLVHGSGGNRDDLLGELQILSKGGFTLLTFDWPGQGESGGRVQWDEPERAAVRSALDWLVARPEVDPARIGAFGFSLGTVPLLQVAVRDPRVRALALAGAPIGYEDHIRWDFRKYGPLSQLPGLWADHLRGMRMEEDQAPVQIVGQLAPRPLLAILGENDVIVPPAKTRALFAAANAPKDLLALPGVGHGEYAARGEAVYAEHLTTFFRRALLPNQVAGAAQ
jgi:pimeloyl-ACP methyl ester carboxylesterase